MAVSDSGQGGKDSLIGLLQRVSRASVKVEDEYIASIGAGLMVLIGVEKTDNADTAKRLVEKLLAYRVFNDDQGRMNLSVLDIAGDVLLVPQFTLAADTTKGLRPGFSTAAPPELGTELFDAVVDIMSQQNLRVEAGRFGADMAVELVNEGPATFWLQV